MKLRLGLRLARTSAALRTYLGLPSPFDDDQDDYWTALPRVERRDALREWPTGRHTLPPEPVRLAGPQAGQSDGRAGSARARSGPEEAESGSVAAPAPAIRPPLQRPRHSESPSRSTPFGSTGAAG